MRATSFSGLLTEKCRSYFVELFKPFNFSCLLKVSTLSTSKFLFAIKILLPQINIFHFFHNVQQKFEILKKRKKRELENSLMSENLIFSTQPKITISCDFLLFHNATLLKFCMPIDSDVPYEIPTFT